MYCLRRILFSSKSMNISIIIKNCVNLINLMNMISSSWSIYIHKRNGDSDTAVCAQATKLKSARLLPVLSARE